MFYFNNDDEEEEGEESRQNTNEDDSDEGRYGRLLKSLIAASKYNAHFFRQKTTRNIF